MKATDKILIGGRALVALGSSRSTLDVDYLVNDESNPEMFIKTEAGDLINAAGHKFFAEVYEQEKGNQIASPGALLELKAFSFVQHCLNGHWQKADDAEYDMKFLVRKFNLSAPKLVKKYVSVGEYSEIIKICNSTK